MTSEHMHAHPLGDGSCRSRSTRSTNMFVRELRHPPHRVWMVLTDPRQLEPWAPLVPERSLANLGAMTLAMTDRPSAATFAGEVTRAVPPTLLEYSWLENLLVWELSPTATGTRLTLNHTVESAACLGKVATDWHTHLILAERLLDGTPPHAVCDPMADRVGSSRNIERPLLTERQAIVLQALLRGKSNKLIGRELNIAEGTVKNHLWSIYQALGVTSRLQIVARAYELGFAGRSIWTEPTTYIVPTRDARRAAEVCSRQAQPFAHNAP